MATRNAGRAVMNAIAEVVPELFGGAADLTASTKTIFKPGAQFPCRSGGAQRVLRRARVWHVRGGERHGGAWRADSVRVDVLLFSDYCKPALRLAALMQVALAVCVHARFDRRWARTGRRTSRSST